MRVIPGNAQDQGERETQEDAFGFSSLGDKAFERHGGFMMVLCDGMGGLANGAIASRAAVDAVLAGYARKEVSEDIIVALERVLREAQEAVCIAAGDGGSSGTTIVIAVVWQERLYWVSLGDSRLYLCREGAPAAQLTADHNVAALLDQQSDTGLPCDADGTTSSREALTAYLGAPFPPQPHTGREMQLRPGDRIVACSDGLYRGLSPEEIATLARRGPPMVAAERMNAAVLKQRLPHQDNLTVTMLEVAPDRAWMESLQTQVSQGLAMAGPTARGALAGFGAAMLLICVLLGFGVLSFGTHFQGTQAAAPASATPVPPAEPDKPPASGENGTSTTRPEPQQRPGDTTPSSDGGTRPAQGQPPTAPAVGRPLSTPAPAPPSPQTRGQGTQNHPNQLNQAKSPPTPSNSPPGGGGN